MQEIPQEQKPKPQPSKIQVTEIAENKALLDNLEYGKVNKPLHFKLPPISLLNQPFEEKNEIDESEIDRKIEDLLAKLKMFRVEGDIVRTYSGPIVTTFEFRPAPHIKVSKILTLEDDLAMANTIIGVKTGMTARKATTVALYIVLAILVIILLYRYIDRRRLV